MERIAYTNGTEKVYKTIERFDIRGTIMEMAVKVVGTYTLHDMRVEDGKGSYRVSIWDNAKGYNPEKLKVGLSVRLKGVVRTSQIYSPEKSDAIEIKTYSALEMD